MSVMVVSSGPEAKAGSALMARNISGIIPPKLTATNVLAASATPTTKPK